MLKQILRVIVLFMLNLTVSGQNTTGGLYAFLNNYSSNAVSSAFGGSALTHIGIDNINFTLDNPSLISAKNNNDFSLSYTEIFAGINQYAAAYSHTFKTFGSFNFSIQYFNYGEFIATEANGDINMDGWNTRKFSAADYLFNVSWGRMLDENVSIGAAFKPVISQYESYSAFAVAFDIAVSYFGNSKNWVTSFLIRNFGTQIKAFNSFEKETLPYDISIAASKKLSHAPFTLYCVFTNIQQWNLMYEDEVSQVSQTDLDGNTNEKSRFVEELDNIFRHLNAGVNFSPSKYFDLSIGFSWKRNREMSVGDSFSLAGFSYGLNIHIKQFTLSYSRNEYHKYGSPNYLTLSVKL